YRIGLKSLGRRYLELHDEIADLDVMIGAIVQDAHVQNTFQMPWMRTKVAFATGL
ncbi:hypothetical protein IWX87_001748, partial [Polaromonas sp. CG_9.7]|nr:hypothetical protein [Polaromonas sp. CG_9.7]MBG6113993.1 hypothetical protein [Polaromonas sp. CG_9.2]